MNPDVIYERVLAQIREEQSQVISRTFADAIKKGIISVRESEPVLVQASSTDGVFLKNSIVIDYLGAEKIEQLEQALAYMTKVNSDLHKSLHEFYEQTKGNTWLKSNPS